MNNNPLLNKSFHKILLMYLNKSLKNIENNLSLNASIAHRSNNLSK